MGLPFNFYHADLGPSNIMVSENGNVEGILDWESAGFYPRYWIVSKVAWRDLLISMLRKEGFE